jgi:ribosomal protein S18 acetylase RimI-like enzyme
MPVAIATEKDISTLVNLLDSAYRGEASKQGWTTEADLFIGTKRTDENVVQELMQKPDAVFLKWINEEGTVEGCVFLHKKQSRLYLGMFAVSPAAQGKGVGKKILTAADAYAKGLGCQSIYMTVITIRAELIAWYEKHGYSKTGELVPFPTDERFGLPTRPLEMLVLEKIL